MDNLEHPTIPDQCRWCGAEAEPQREIDPQGRVVERAVCSGCDHAVRGCACPQAFDLGVPEVLAHPLTTPWDRCWEVRGDPGVIEWP